MIELKRILVPTDFSEYGKLATRYGVALAEQFQADLHLLHVIDDYFLLAPEANLMLPDRNQYLRDLKAAADQELAQSPANGALPAARIVRCSVVGRPFEEIARYAGEHEVDLIVIGSHGRRGFSHLLLGSVAERVVRTAGCPVLTVRTDQHRFVSP